MQMNALTRRFERINLDAYYDDYCRCEAEIEIFEDWKQGREEEIAELKAKLETEVGNLLADLKFLRSDLEAGEIKVGCFDRPEVLSLANEMNRLMAALAGGVR